MKQSRISRMVTARLRAAALRAGMRELDAEIERAERDSTRRYLNLGNTGLWVDMGKLELRALRAARAALGRLQSKHDTSGPQKPG